MTTLRIVCLTAILTAMCVVLSEAQVRDEEALLRLNRELLESVFLRQDTTLLSAVALPTLIVVPPGGIVENRAQVMNGVHLTAMDSVRIDDIRIAGQGEAAVVISRVTRLGILPAGAGTGRIRIMSVFVYDRSQWKLLARSVTPCIDRAVAVGRC